MKYSVTYGVNNSHLTECNLFQYYRDAIQFFDNLTYPSAVVYKLGYDRDGYVKDKEVKKWKSESGKDNTNFLESLK